MEKFFTPVPPRDVVVIINHYYHCSAKCGYRQKAELVNEEFGKFLSYHTLSRVVEPFFKIAVLDSYTNCTRTATENRKGLINEITRQNNRITKGRELLLNGDIDIIFSKSDINEKKNGWFDNGPKIHF